MTIIISERQLKVIQNFLLEERELLTEERLNWKIEKYVPGKIYQFQPISDTNIFQKLNNFTCSSHPKNPEISQYTNKNGDVVYYSRQSDSGSKYYQTKLGVPTGKKKIIRCSNHYSYYIYPDFIMEDLVTGMQKKVTCIFGTQRTIPGVGLFYTIVLPDKYKKLITQEMVRNAYNKKDKYGKSHTYPDKKTGDIFVILDTNTLGIKDNIDLCGEIIIPDSDNSVFVGL